MLPPHWHRMLGRGAKDKEHAMSQKLESAIAVIGIDIGKNSFHIVGQVLRGWPTSVPGPGRVETFFVSQ